MPDAKTNSDIIEKALNTVMAANEDHEEGDILVEWVVVCFVDNPNKALASAYPILFSNGEMPTYRARGLLVTALELMSPSSEG